MKSEIEWSARKIGQVAEWAGEEAIAAIEGFVEGWIEPSVQPIDLNSATYRQLERLPGITHQDAQKIISARPYHDKQALVTERVISEAAYRRIRDRIAVN